LLSSFLLHARLRRRLTTVAATAALAFAGMTLASPAHADTGADLGLAMTATGHPGLFGGHIDYALTATNHGPGELTFATITVTLPPPMNATTSNCFIISGHVTCTIGTMPVGASATGFFSVPIGLLTIGLPYTVTATITASAPADPNPANNTATETCEVLTSLIVTCS
jgi:hypothetical protein